ncbi:hypothetical protein MSAN_02002700 [Mycena sanguinolenta]|uniref:Uncharacterized protein n=1 Tax=Mycena sanguinolenta TaxID=230812 RepID=A0A8H7CM64_9AGAR|nr:hypothetical protein MSAN_02002700 [Mycena sanguinolenta]
MSCIFRTLLINSGTPAFKVIVSPLVPSQVSHKSLQVAGRREENEAPGGVGTDGEVSILLALLNSLSLLNSQMLGTIKIENVQLTGGSGGNGGERNFQ